MPNTLSIKERIVPHVLEFLVALAGCVSTLYIWNHSELNNVFVCESLSLSYSILFPNKYDDIFFAGSLAGISSETYYSSPGFVFLLAIFVFLFFKICRNMALGFGGRLGTFAFCANLSVCYFSYLNQGDDYPFYDDRFYKALNIYIYIFGPLISGASCFFSYILHNYFHLTKFVAINANGIMFSMVLLSITAYPTYDNRKFIWNYGETFNVFAHIGLLAAILKENLVKEFTYKNYMFVHYLLIGYLSGWIFIGVFAFFTVGGKNGFMSFITCNIYVRTLRMYCKYKAYSNVRIGTIDIIEKNTNESAERRGSIQNHLQILALNNIVPIDNFEIEDSEKNKNANL